MATVYLARDLRHERLVALKVLRPELAATLGPERFLREIRLAARLQHPHILTVLDSGEAAGLLWYTMPYVEGESLRDRLNREKQLPLGDALRITTEAALALDYAHRHGVVHRDIKPENILLSDDQALVADFGVARALEEGSEGKLTETGLAVGTPAYMSPEQASGSSVDRRSDVYSLGCVLYEMLAGEPPYTGPSPQAIIAKRLADPVPSIRRLRERIPETLDQALMQAMAKVPADRFGTAAEFSQALTVPGLSTSAGGVRPAYLGAGPAAPAKAIYRRHVLTGVAALALTLLLGLGVLFQWRRTRSAEPAGVRRVAVLPFENLGRPEDEYFADGITDAVRGKLTALPGLEVIARTSSSEYKQTRKSPQQIGRELGVQYLLTGTVRWEKATEGSSRVRVTPELVQVATASTKWQAPFEAPLTDVFQVQADVAARVAEALGLALGAAERERLAERPTASLAAYDNYLHGEAVSQSLTLWDGPTVRRALGFYERAVSLDSTFAPAWAQLARARASLYFTGTPTASLAKSAQTAAARAQAIAPGRPETQLAWGWYLFFVRYDYAEALRAFEAGLREHRDNADLLASAAQAEFFLGHWEAAMKHFQRAQTLDPRAVRPPARLTRALLWSRRYTEARRTADQALALAPTNLDMLSAKVESYLGEGDLAGARAVLRGAPKEVDPTALVAYVAQYWDLAWVLDSAQQQLLLRLSPTAFDNDRAVWGIALAQTYWVRHDHARARIYADSARLGFEEQLRGAPESGQHHVGLGVALAYLGRKAEAVREGERGVALIPMAKDHFNGPYYQHQLARIYVLVGEPEKALDRLEVLLRLPYELSPSWLKIDPTFAPLRVNPHFERLVATK